MSSAYADLPVIDERGDYRHAWNDFAPDDDLGCLGRISPSVRAAALRSVTDGTAIPLSLPLDEPSPSMFGRGPLRHTIFAPHRNSLDDKYDDFYPQGTTQWDGFRHIRAREHGFFTGHQGDFAPDDPTLGIGSWARQGIIGRGVLLDVSERFRRMVQGGLEEVDCIIDVEDLERAADEARVEIHEGDILCIRTGWLEHHRSISPQRRRQLAEMRRWPGLAGSSAMAELLWDWGLAAVTADNPAVEVGPGLPELGSLHRRLLPLLGMPMGELFDFEGLAAECRRRERGAFVFVSVPLYMPTGVGSTGNAVAVF